MYFYDYNCAHGWGHINHEVKVMKNVLNPLFFALLFGAVASSALASGQQVQSCSGVMFDDGQCMSKIQTVIRVLADAKTGQ